VPPSPRGAARLGIAAITQELTLAPSLSVAENIVMGRLPSRRGGCSVDWRRARRIARDALDELGVEVDERRPVGELSIELQQEVEIARALARRPRILILDEATSSLSEAATAKLIARMRDLRDRGVAIVFVSHRMRELYQCADRATVLRDGLRVCTVPLPETSEDELVAHMVGREISDLYAKRTIAPGRPRLVVRGLQTADGQLREVSLSVAGGEIVGVAGLVGSGKEELGLALAGAVPAEGAVRIDGRPASLANPRAAMRAGIALVPQDRKRMALFPTLSAQRNLSMALLNRLTRGGVLRVGHERRLATEMAARFSIRLSALDSKIVHLSGGNQQKVVLARVMSLRPQVVVLSEPTRGVDVGAKAEIYQVVQDMAAEGAAILIISSELPELLGLADRILVMVRGRIRAEFPREHATEENVAGVALGAGEAVA
jgi:ABC-type sugar transport system ATPase subunit